MRRLLLLRPEPGLSASAERAKALGMDVLGVPLFRVESTQWQAPDPAGYDALLLTSANAVRHGGPELGALNGLPVHAVGDATATAARDAGFTVASVGEAGVAELLARLPGRQRLLHLAGEDRREVARDHAVDVRMVYRSTAIDQPALPPLESLVIAVHSPRAGARLAELAERRDCTAIAAISAEAAHACGDGWASLEAADAPDDASLLALAARLCQISSPK